MPEIISASDVPGLLEPGMTVFVQGATGEPLALTGALVAEPQASAGVHYVTCFVPGVNRTDLAALTGTTTLTTFFVQAELKDSFDAGRVRFLPLHYSGICGYFAELAPPDLALIQVSPPDADGMCSLGIAIDFVPIVFDKAKRIVAEVNRMMPSPAGSLKVPYDRFSHVVEAEHPLVLHESGDIPAPVATIGERIAGLIEDGDTFQIGIGKVPAAILSRLDGKRDLGLQGGMVTDEVMKLHQAGVITGARKTYAPGKILCGMALGSQALYDWAGACPDILYRPATVTHDVRVIAQIDNFVSINSVLEVDLTGQANAEMVNGRQVSGTGGLVDFVRGARMARNGRSIVALMSTAGRGAISRIVPKLDDRAVVSCPRADIDYVVTEHGTARLKHKTIDERAEALIAIADPAFRGMLGEAWQRMRSTGRFVRE
ncbi:MAG TPA: acetyl-CoA hydrolase/transferase C-terminal domain-containing protein [Alphaproteobacteria bacterium]|jgi:4-hydroxybutyrate CoA-transferase|nr:acetyl-CoA hydrolase/transferase C-terminal domain-containing protein [Alphaproteobacteria bacterium]